MMSLVKYNRDIVRLGLKYINENRYLNIIKLLNNQENETSSATETEKETQEPEKKNEIKYLNVDKDFINNSNFTAISRNK